MTGLKSRALPMLTKAVLAFVCILGCSEFAAAHDVALVTSKDSCAKGATSADLAKMIKTTHKCPDGHDLMVVLISPFSLETRIAAAKLLSLTPQDFKKLIDEENKERVIFVVVSSDDEVLKAVQGNTSAIGLVNVYNINSNVDALKIDGKLPLEFGYALHSQ
jgi:hypothetical protein